MNAAPQSAAVQTSARNLPYGPTALITGASDGIGKAFA